jgi:hypothetical protein
LVEEDRIAVDVAVAVAVAGHRQVGDYREEEDSRVWPVEIDRQVDRRMGEEESIAAGLVVESPCFVVVVVVEVVVDILGR